MEVAIQPEPGVFDSDDALVDVIWTLIDQVRDPAQAAFGAEQKRFWDLYNNVEILHEALTVEPSPISRQRRATQLR